VGRGVDRRFEEKNLEGSGRTVDLVCGNWKGLSFLLLDIASLNWYEWYSSCFCVFMLLKKAKCCLRWFNGYGDGEWSRSIYQLMTVGIASIGTMSTTYLLWRGSCKPVRNGLNGWSLKGGK
jgi:hypothetical protein